MTKAESAPDFPRPRTISEHRILLSEEFDAGGLTQRPELASMIMAYINHASELDLKLECAALIAMGGGAGMADAFLAGMSALDHSHRRSAIIAIIDKKLDISKNSHRKLFEGITKSRELRNFFAHGLWYATDELPDALVLTKSHSELKRFGVGLDTIRGEKTRRSISKLLLDMLPVGDKIPPTLAKGLFDLLEQTRSPWDRTYGQEAQLESHAELLAQQAWFGQDPQRNIDWSKVVQHGNQRPRKRSEALALGGSVHDAAEIWDSALLNQALDHIRYAKAKAQDLISLLLPTV